MMFTANVTGQKYESEDDDYGTSFDLHLTFDANDEDQMIDMVYDHFQNLYNNVEYDIEKVSVIEGVSPKIDKEGISKITW